jgi:hypothetical protein
MSITGLDDREVQKLLLDETDLEDQRQTEYGSVGCRGNSSARRAPRHGLLIQGENREFQARAGSDSALPMGFRRSTHVRTRARHGVKRMAGHHLSDTRCGARTRKGTPCQRRTYPNGRCRNHGGLCTGPKTQAGKSRIAAAQRLRWQLWRFQRSGNVQATN